MHRKHLILILLFHVFTIAVAQEEHEEHETGETGETGYWQPGPRDIVGETTERAMGITEEHRNKLQKWVDQYNVALLFRVSDLTSVKLISTNKFSSKAQNIHDKSSDWGPQQGTVPMDPYFNKKHGTKLPDPPSGMTTECNYGEYDKDVCTKSPTPDILTLRKDAIEHADELESEIADEQYKTRVKPTHLFLTDELINQYLHTTTLELCEVDTCTGQEQCPEDKDKCKCVQDKKDTLDTNLQEQTFCLVKEGADRWDVYWQDRREPPHRHKLHELHVWSYNDAPVTGDYDLWMVAPHMKNAVFAEAGKSSIRERWEYMTKLEQYPTRGNEKDGSMMTPLVRDLMYSTNRNLNLNMYLDRKPGHEVFHHGVEMDNFFYLQPLDGEISVIVPSNQELPAYLRTGGVEQRNMAKLLASLQAHGYFVATNPHFQHKDPRLEGKKVQTDQDRDAETKVHAMRALMHNLYIERGTDVWTSDTVNDLNPRRMSDDCVPPRVFEVPRMTWGDWTNARTATEPDTLPDLAGHASVTQKMNIAEDEEMITEIPTECQDESLTEETCGSTPTTVGKCKWRNDQCDVYSRWPMWGKVEFELCTIEEDADDNFVCGTELFQWCRRVSEDVPALKHAEGKLKLDELQFSQWLVLTRVVSAMFQQVLARHFIVMDARAKAYAAKNDGKAMPVSQQLTSGMHLYNDLHTQTRHALCPELENAGVAIATRPLCNKKLGACLSVARLVNAGVPVPEAFYEPELIHADGEHESAGSIRETCTEDVQKQMLEMEILSPRGAFKEAMLWTTQLRLFKKVLKDEGNVWGERPSSPIEDEKMMTLNTEHRLPHLIGRYGREKRKSKRESLSASAQEGRVRQSSASAPEAKPMVSLVEETRPSSSSI